MSLGAHLQELVEEFRAGLRRAPRWSAVTLDGSSESEAVLDAGGFDGVSWFRYAYGGRGPQVWVIGDSVLLTAIGLYSGRLVERPRSLDRLERLVGDRYVRVPLGLVEAGDPGLLPVSRAANWGSGVEWGMARRLLPSERAALPPALASDEPGEIYGMGMQRLRIDPTRPCLDVTDGDAVIRMTYACERVPFPVPTGSQILDPADLGIVLLPATLPPAPAGYHLEIYEEEDEQGRPYWVLQGHDLGEALGVEGNVAAQDLVIEQVDARRPDLARHVRFDSEGGCFFGYADSRQAAEDLVTLISDLVTQGNHGTSH